MDTPVQTPPDVSVIVIGHDVRDEVLSCLASIEAHRGSLVVETIVVDNGSRDGTAEAVEQRFPAAIVIRRPTNEGVAARNHGLRVARGRMRMFLDSDARLTDNALARMVEYIDEHPGVGLVGPRLVYPDGRLQLSARRYPPLALPLLRRPPLGHLLEDSGPVRHHLMADEPHDRARAVEYVLGACQLFSAEAQHAAGEIDVRIFYGHDDADWCFAVRTAGFECVYLPEGTVVHDYRRSTAKRPLSGASLAHLRAFLILRWKWRSRRRELIEAGRVMDAQALASRALAAREVVPAGSYAREADE